MIRGRFTLLSDRLNCGSEGDIYGPYYVSRIVFIYALKYVYGRALVNFIRKTSSRFNVEQN